MELSSVKQVLLDVLQASGRPVVTLLVALIVALVGHAVLYAALKRVARRTPWRTDEALVKGTRRPARAVAMLVAMQLVRPILGLTGGGLAFVQHLLSLALIGCVTWMAIAAIRTTKEILLLEHRLDAEDNLQARKAHTQVRVIERILVVVAVIIGLSAMLMTFPQVRQLGTSILASAGIAGIIIGMALQSTLANFFAGLQIALTQPIRLDDVVIVSGEWGRIEEITTTYVVVRIWDERRLVVPFSKFISEPFQNWTRTNAEILGTIFLHADYRVPVSEVRAEVERIVKGSDLWDGRVVGLIVTGANEGTVELRALISAADSGKAWDLRCLVREKLLEWLQREHPECLPRTRIEVEAREGVRALGSAEA